MAIELDDVTVRRGEREVIAGVSAQLAPSAALMLRGPNGSGKTSLLRAIAGLSRHDGEVIFRRDVKVLDPSFIRSHELHLIGTEPGLSPRLTVKETAEFLAGFYDQPKVRGLGDLRLDNEQNRRVGELSSGQRRRLALLRLLMAPRALWLLDEPFAALDREGIALVEALIGAHRERGGIVVVALHDPVELPEAQTLRVVTA